MIGATEIRHVFGVEQLPHIVSAYLAALRVVWAVTAAIGGLAFLISLMGSRKRLFRGEEKKNKDDIASTAS